MTTFIPTLIRYLVEIAPYALGFAAACALVVGLLSALQYRGESLTKNEPFSWASAYPKFKRRR